MQSALERISTNQRAERIYEVIDETCISWLICGAPHDVGCARRSPSSSCVAPEYGAAGCVGCPASIRRALWGPHHVQAQHTMSAGHAESDQPSTSVRNFNASSSNSSTNLGSLISSSGRDCKATNSRYKLYPYFFVGVDAVTRNARSPRSTMDEKVVFTSP